MSYPNRSTASASANEIPGEATQSQRPQLGFTSNFAMHHGGLFCSETSQTRGQGLSDVGAAETMNNESLEHRRIDNESLERRRIDQSVRTRSAL